MEYTSLPFLFLFMPLTAIVFLVAQVRFRPVVLLTASVIFIAWNNPLALIVYVLLVGGNFLFGKWIEKNKEEKRRVALSVVYNLAILVFYKLFTTYNPTLFIHKFELILPDLFENYLLTLVYPIGLSYISIQMISYLVDVAHGTTTAEENLVNFALYATFFPKIMTGPIALNRVVKTDLTVPKITSSNTADGLRRFALGLIKKVLIADQIAKISNPAFGLTTPNFPPAIAWLALMAFTLQIYYDFSGFTDMAIGLGKLFGVTLPENFNQPFTAQSIGEFWRRWHMSLSAWFREYVFYPLERHRFLVLGQQINIIVVFILTGLWHGLTGNFVVWGLIHGITIALESAGLAEVLKKTWRPIQTIYVIGIVSFSWIFFRSPTLLYAWSFIGRLMGNVTGIAPLPFSTTRPLPFIDPTTWFALGAGILFLFPMKATIAPLLEKIKHHIPSIDGVIKPVSDLILLTFFWAGIAVLTGGGYMPGIYDKF